MVCRAFNVNEFINLVYQSNTFSIVNVSYVKGYVLLSFDLMLIHCCLNLSAVLKSMMIFYVQLSTDIINGNLNYILFCPDLTFHQKPVKAVVNIGRAGKVQ